MSTIGNSTRLEEVSEGGGTSCPVVPATRHNSGPVLSIPVPVQEGLVRHRAHSDSEEESSLGGPTTACSPYELLVLGRRALQLHTVLQSG